jgi:SIR2-like domain
VIKTIQIEGKKYLIVDYLVYTTNYDLIQEKYWQGVTEINDLIERDDRDREILDLRRLPENYSYRGPPKQIKYVKLHGSLNLYRLSDGTIVKMESPGKKYGRTPVEEELMIYPIHQKDLYLYPWFDLFKQFKTDLDHTKNWIFIGYSFNDEFITNIILEILRKGNKKLIIVSPHASHIKEKFSAHKESIIDISTKFGEKVTNESIFEALK